MDNLKYKAPRDGNTISLMKDRDVKYWSGNLGISSSELVEAIKKVGNSASKVREYLNKKNLKQ
jgi:hypothetical protein